MEQTTDQPTEHVSHSILSILLNPKTLTVPNSVSELRIFDCSSEYWPEVFEELAKLQHLNRLVVYRCRITGDISGGLAKMTNLRELVIENYGLRMMGLMGLNNLRNLNLNGGNIGDQAAIGLSCLENLRTLDLTCNNLSDRSIIVLASSLTDLYFFGLLNNRVTSEGAKYIARMPRLQELFLNNNSIGDEGVKYLSRGLPTLRVLKLRSNGLSNQSIRIISKCMSNLRVLSIGNMRGDFENENIIDNWHVIQLSLRRDKSLQLSFDGTRTKVVATKQYTDTLRRLNRMH